MVPGAAADAVHPRGDVTLANWQDPPHQRWAFRHMRELIPSQVVAAGTTPTSLQSEPLELDDVAVTRLDGSAATVGVVLEETWTDAVVVLHHDRLVLERYWAGMTPTTQHLLMSVTKSVVGCVAGNLVEQGRLDPESPVTEYVPEVAGSGYAGASVRDVLDMRTGVQFREEYTSIDAEVRVMERSMGWRPLQPGDPVGAYNYLATIGTSDPHGGPFTYRSADTDLLGWVCERAAGRPMAELMSDLVWVPIGAECDAEITCDAVGTAIHDGGLSCTARDLARFGRMLLGDGVVAGSRVVPAPWIEDARTPPADVREAFARSSNEAYLPGGWYRSQFWFIPSDSGPVLLCLGIHGQMVYVDWSRDLVAVKLSSWPDAQNPAFLIPTIRAFAAIGRALSPT